MNRSLDLRCDVFFIHVIGAGLDRIGAGTTCGMDTSGHTDRVHPVYVEWHHVKRHVSPVDILSQWCLASELPHRWLHGQEFVEIFKCYLPEQGYVDKFDYENNEHDGF